MTSGSFTLAQLARTVRMSVDDVRFYRECGFLQPPRRRRSRSDDQAFHAEHVARLRFIKRALGYGFSLETIAQLLDPGAMLTSGDVKRIAAARLEQLRAERRPDDPTVLALASLVDSCSGKGGREDCRILAALAKGGH